MTWRNNTRNKYPFNESEIINRWSTRGWDEKLQDHEGKEDGVVQERDGDERAGVGEATLRGFGSNNFI